MGKLLDKHYRYSSSSYVLAKRISDNFFFNTFEQRDSLEKLLLRYLVLSLIKS